MSDGSLGIRQNNPTNLIVTSDRWLGQVEPKAGERFCTFTAPEYGIRAAVRVLRKHYASGATTIRKLITIWAPPNENDTAAYIAAVSAAVGVAPDAVLPDPEVLVAPIIMHENGVQPYTPEFVAKGIALEKGTIMATPSTNTAIV